MIKFALPTVLLALLLSASFASAEPKEYQVTGPITAMTDTTITVQKGKELWELSRSSATKVTGGDLKVGDKVTAMYTMTASSIEDKGAAPAGAKSAKKDKPAAAAGAAPAASPAKP